MKNTQKGFIIPLIIAILAVLAIGGGVYAYHEKKVADIATSEEMNIAANATTSIDGNIQNTQTQTNTNPVTSNVSAGVNTSIQTSNTKMFTNSQYDLSFSYPSAYNLTFADHQSVHGTNMQTPNNDNVEKDGYIFTGSTPIVGNIVLTFFAFQNADPDLRSYVQTMVTEGNEENQKLVSEFGDSPTTMTFSDITVNGIPAYEIHYVYPSSADRSNGTAIYLQNGSHMFLFSFDDTNSTQVNQILSTLKF